MPQLPKITREIVAPAQRRPRTRLPRASTPGREPRIPGSVITQPRVPFSVGRQPGVSAEDLGAGAFRALGELGSDLLELGREIKRDEERGKAVEIVGNIGIEIERSKADLKARANHDTYLNLFGEEKKRIASTTRERFKGLSDPTRRWLENNLTSLLSRAEQDAIAEQSKLSVQHQRGELTTSLDTLAGLAARDPDPLGRARWQTMGATRIDSLGDGILNPSEVPEWKRRFLKRIQGQRLIHFSTELNSTLDNLANKALRDPDNASQYFQEGLGLIAGTARDWLPKKKVAEVEDRFGSDLWTGTVLGRIERDPSFTLAELQKGKYDQFLDQKDIIELRGKAETEIRRRIRIAEAQRKESERQVGKLVTDYEQAKMAGFKWRGPISEERLLQMSLDTKHAGKFLMVREASKYLDQFHLLPPFIQEQRLRELRAGPKTGDEAKFIGTLERAHEATTQGLENDPLTFAVNQGFIPAPPPLDLNNPATLQERSRLAGMAEQHYRVPVSPLSDDEAQQLRLNLEDATADEQVVIFQRLTKGLEDRHVKMAAGQISKHDRITALAMGLSTEAPVAASRIVRGKDLLKENPKLQLSGTEMASARKDLSESTAEAYQHNPEHFAAVSEAALAVYAYKSWREKDFSGVLDSSRLDESVKEVTGGLLTISRGFLSGSYTIQPPRYGMTEDDWTEMLKQGDYSAALGFDPEAIQRNGIFENVGAGKYLVRVGPGYIQSESGPFILDLSKIEPKTIGRKLSVEVGLEGIPGAP